MNWHKVSTLLISTIVPLSATSITAEPLSYFRHDGGVAMEDLRPVVDRFDDAESLVWRQELAPGHSTPCIWGDSIFMTTFDAEKQELATVCLDLATGQLRWTRPVPARSIEPFHPVGSPASCTPACDGQRLFAFFGSYGLICYDLEGNVLWSKEMGPFQDEFGANSSPILVDGKVVLNQDHDIGSFLMAMDQATGETVWRVEREGFTRSYSTPTVCTHNDTQYIIVAGALKLVAYDVKDGREVWWVSGLSRIVDSTPLVAGGLVYLATWTPGGDANSRISMEPFSEALRSYDKNGDGKIMKDELPEGDVQQRFFRIDLDQDGALDDVEWSKYARVFELAQNVAMAIEPGGSGDVTNTHVKWIGQRGLPTVPSPLVYRGVVYLVKDGGIITTMDAATGNILKQGRAPGRGNYYASPVAADGKVYLASEQGVVTVLEATGEWKLLSYRDFGERIMATPVMNGGRVYLRTEKALYCYSRR
jgi:outer membrane protein assembly factor BamB